MEPIDISMPSNSATLKFPENSLQLKLTEVGPPGPNTVSTSTSTSITGIIKGNGSTIATAIAGTDYVIPSALTAYAPLVSPSFTGTPTTITQSASDNSTKIASTAYVTTAVLNAASTYDDVLDYSTMSAFPTSGATGILYIANDTNYIYRWGGSSYTQVGGASVAAATATSLGTIELAGDLGGTAAAPTVNPANFTNSGKVKQTVYNMLDYSCVINGTTDDSSALQALANTVNGAGGGIIWNPGGTSLINTPVILGSNTVLAGPNYGKAGFTTSMTTTNNQGIIQINNKNNIQITGLNFTIGGNACAITTTGHDTLKIDHCGFTGSSTGDGVIEFNGANGIAVMQNTVIENNKFYSIPSPFRTIHIYPRYTNYVYNTLVQSNEFVSTSGPAVMLDAYALCRDTTVTKNKFDNIISGSSYFQTAVGVYGGINSTNPYVIFSTSVTDNKYRNTLTTNAQQGFCYIYQSTDTIISSNTMVGAWTSTVNQPGPAIAPGRVANPNVGMTITGNTIRGFDAPWDPDAMRSVECANNTVEFCGTPFNTGYNVQEYVSIHDNIFRNCFDRNISGAGIQLNNSNPLKNNIFNNLFIDDRSIPAPSGVTGAISATSGTLTVSTPYYYVITALDTVGQTIASTQVSATPTTGNQSVLLKWNYIIGAVSYNVYRSITSGTYGATSLVTNVGQSNNPETSNYGLVTYIDTGTALVTGTPPTSSTVATATMTTPIELTGNYNFSDVTLHGNRFYLPHGTFSSSNLYTYQSGSEIPPSIAYGNEVSDSTGIRISGNIVSQASFTNSGIVKQTVYNVKDYGAFGNGKYLSNGAVTASSSTFTSSTAAFTSAATGKSILIAGAGASGATLSATITYVSATSVTLSTSATTTVSGANFVYGTDDTTAIQSAMTAANLAGQGQVLLNGIHLISTTLNITSNVTLIAQNKSGGTLTGNVTLLSTTQSGTTSSIYSNISLKSIKFINFTGHCMSIFNTSWLTVSDCEYTSAVTTPTREACWVQYCQNVVVDGNYLHNLTGNGIQINATSYFTVANNQVSGGSSNSTQDDGIDIDCDFLNTASIGSSYGTVTGNTVNGIPSGCGIRVEDSAYITVTGNTVTNINNVSTVAGIQVDQSATAAANGLYTKQITVTGNSLSNCVTAGISVIGTTNIRDIVVSDNVLELCGQTGGSNIRAGIVVNAPSTRVQNNYLYNCGTNSGNQGAIVVYQTTTTNVWVTDNNIVSSYYGIRVWNGNGTTTYTAVYLLNNIMQGNTTDYTDAYTQSGVYLRTLTSTGLGLGKINATSLLDVNGTVTSTGLKMTSSPTSGYVLTSDSSGNATWQGPSGASGSASGDLTGTYPNPTLSNTTNVKSIISSNTGGQVTRSATLVVAASNATTLEKTQADYVCTGTLSTGGDDVQINAAITAMASNGGRVKLSSGSFYLSNPVLLNQNYITVEGCGIQSTHIYVANSLTINAFQYTGSSAIIFCSLKDMEIDGATTGAYGIYIAPTGAGTFWDFYVRDVFVDQVTSDGFYSYDGHGFVLDHFLAEQCGGYGVNFPTALATSEGEVRNGTFKKNIGGIYMGLPAGIVSENEIQNLNGGDGIVLAGNGSKSIGNYIGNNPANGITHSASGTVSSNNYIYSNAGYGINVNYRNCIVQENNVITSTLHGIYVQASPYNQIVNNYVNSNSEHGIYSLGTGTIISGNSLYQNSSGNTGTYDEIRATGNSTIVSNNTIYGASTSNYGINFSSSGSTGMVGMANQINGEVTAATNSATNSVSWLSNGTGNSSISDVLTLPNGATINGTINLKGSSMSTYSFQGASDNTYNLGGPSARYATGYFTVLHTNGYNTASSTITSATTLTTTSNELELCNSTSAFTVTLPSTTTAGLRFTIKNINTGTITVAGTIDGATNYSLATQYKYVTVTSTTNSGTWYVIANN